MYLCKEGRGVRALKRFHQERPFPPLFSVFRELVVMFFDVQWVSCVISVMTENENVENDITRKNMVEAEMRI